MYHVEACMFTDMNGSTLVEKFWYKVIVAEETLLFTIPVQVTDFICLAFANWRGLWLGQR